MQYHENRIGHPGGIDGRSLALALLLHAAAVVLIVTPFQRHHVADEIVYLVEMVDLPLLPETIQGTTGTTGTAAKTTAPSRPDTAKSRSGPSFSPDAYLKNLNERLTAAGGGATKTTATGSRSTSGSRLASVKIPRITPAEKTAGGPRGDGTSATLPAGITLSELYLSQIRTRIKANWQPGKSIAGSTVTISFRLLRNGSIDNLAVEQPSVNRQFDAAAIEAVRKTKNLPPFPDEMRQPYLDVAIEFSTEE